ncbi:MAG TPA: MBL fold metallo-hydrolase [Bryobacteraceae bacterium]|nr:MBL fold metallo-hydrolase [Bryobacteraceae bacterium]
MRNCLLVVVLFCLSVSPAFSRNLEIFFIDVEGGQSTLIVTPSRQSLLVDTGWPDFSGRDADRIVAAAKKAGVKRIDYLIITHHHADHVGGVPNLVERMPVGTFVDHGPTVETGKQAKSLYEAYLKAIGSSQHMVVKPGDKIPLKGVDVVIVEAGGEHITTALPGAGQPNPYCASVQPRANDSSENAQSTGFVLTYGKFRFVDLGDLTWNKEMNLVCPNNLIGKVDVYLTTHHGMNLSNNPAIVDALHPRVAIMNNGAKKGGSVEAWTTVKNSPGLEDLWQLHFAVAGGKDHNVPDSFIANVDENCQGKYISLSATPDGGFVVTNSRNKYTKVYAPK